MVAAVKIRRGEDRRLRDEYLETLALAQVYCWKAPLTNYRSKEAVEQMLDNRWPMARVTLRQKLRDMQIKPVSRSKVRYLPGQRCDKIISISAEAKAFVRGSQRLGESFEDTLRRLLGMPPRIPINKKE